MVNDRPGKYWIQMEDLERKRATDMHRKLLKGGDLRSVGAEFGLSAEGFRYAVRKYFPHYRGKRGPKPKQR